MTQVGTELWTLLRIALYSSRDRTLRLSTAELGETQPNRSLVHQQGAEASLEGWSTDFTVDILMQ